MKKQLIFILFSLNSFSFGMSDLQRHQLNVQDLSQAIENRNSEKTRILLANRDFSSNEIETFFWKAKEAHSRKSFQFKKIISYLGYGLITAGVAADFMSSFSSRKLEDRDRSTYTELSLDYAQRLLPKILFVTGVYLICQQNINATKENAIVTLLDMNRTKKRQ